jgi:hypothetical protein
MLFYLNEKVGAKYAQIAMRTAIVCGFWVFKVRAQGVTFDSSVNIQI